MKSNPAEKKAQNRERGEIFSPNFEFGRGLEREKQWGGGGGGNLGSN